MEKPPRCSTACITKSMVLVTLHPRGDNISRIILPTSSKVHHGIIMPSIISSIWLQNIDPKSFVAQALAKQRMPWVTCWFAVLETLCMNLTWSVWQAHHRQQRCKIMPVCHRARLGKILFENHTFKGGFGAVKLAKQSSPPWEDFWGERGLFWAWSFFLFLWRCIK